MKTAIIIPFNTAIEMTRECVTRIRATTNREEIDLILIHAHINGNIMDVSDIDYDAVCIMPNESYCKTINQGLNMVGKHCDRVFLMGNDSFPITEEWLPKLEEIRTKHDIKVLSPDYTAGGKKSITGENEDVWFHSMLPSIHYYMKVDTLKEIGLMDERFIGACYYSDDDYSRRVMNKYGTNSIARCKNIIFEHRLSVEGKALKITNQMGINNKIYTEKWK